MRLLSVRLPGYWGMGLFGGASVLILGSLAAQAVTVLISPVLTRMYSPSDIGTFALYASGIAILTLLFTGRYDFAVISPRTNGAARNLVHLVNRISLAALVLSLAALLIWSVFSRFSGGIPLMQSWFWAVPVGALLSAMQAAYAGYLLRNRRYGSIATVRVTVAICSAALSVIFGLFSFGPWGLLLSSLVALTVGGVLSKRFSRLSWLWGSGSRRLKAVAKRFISFPRIDLPASLLGVVGSQLPTLLLGAMFGATFVGYYAIVDRIFLAPLNIIGGSIASVFRVRATDAALQSGEFRAEFVRTFVVLLVPAMLLFLPIMAFGEDLFVLIFGGQWAAAGKIAEILCPLYLIRLVASPLSMSLYVRYRMKVDLIGQFVLCISAVIAMTIGWRLSDPWAALRAIVICNSVVYVAYIAYSWRLSKAPSG